MSLNQFIHEYLEWQVAKHNRGEKALAAWKVEFPNEIDGDAASDNKTGTTYTVVRKGGKLQGPALFFHKEDVSSCVPAIKGGDADDSVECEEFPSLFSALHSLFPHSGKTANSENALNPKAEPMDIESSTPEPMGSGPSETQPGETAEASTNLPNPNDVTGEVIPKPSSAEDNTATPATPMQVSAAKSAETVTSNSRKQHISPDSLQTMFSKPIKPKVEGSTTSEEAEKQNPSGTPNSNDGFPNFRLKSGLWDQRFEELAAYWDGENTVYQSQISNNKSLTNWVKHQRKCFKRRSVPPIRLQKLDSIGFKWVGRNSVVLSNKPQEDCELVLYAQPNAAVPPDDKNDAWTALWDSRFQELLDYKRRFGDTKVPKEWAENKKLAGWVRKQREHYRKQAVGENTAMTESRKRKLIEIGFVWSIRPGRLKHPLPPAPLSQPSQECIMGKEDDSPDVEPYFVDRNGHLII